VSVSWERLVTLAQVAALAALSDEEHVQRSVEVVREGVSKVPTALDTLGVRHAPSHANFILAEFDDATRVYDELLKRGVIVRPMASFGLTRALRITVGAPEDNARLIDGPRAVLGNGGARS
jgi:histidinol-phosphate aminotransferase